MTSEGKVDLKLPQLREALQPFASRILSEMRGKTSCLERLVQEIYVQGPSTREIEALFEDLHGVPLLSPSAVREMTEALRKEYEAFGQRRLDGFEVEYLFLDAVYESMRLYRGLKEGILVP